MLAVDTNILVYAHRRESRYSDKSHEMLRHLAEGNLPWGIPWPCCYEFLSVVTNRKIWKEAATSPDRAWHQLQTWEASPSLRMLGETDGFMDILNQFVNRPRIMGGVVHDARIAAICAAHGVEALLTRDRDFSMFPQLKTVDLLSFRL